MAECRPTHRHTRVSEAAATEEWAACTVEDMVEDMEGCTAAGTEAWAGFTATA